MEKFKEFLKRKDIVFSAKRYFIDAMSGMAQGLFASLLVGTILSTVAKYIGMIDGAFFARFFPCGRRRRRGASTAPRRCSITFLRGFPQRDGGRCPRVPRL